MSSINNRQWPRFPFRPGMWVKVVRAGAPIETFKMYQLIDISQGGISLKAHRALEFRRGDELHILEVEGQPISDAIQAKVVYVQAMDEFGVDYKVGIEFLTRLEA